MDDGRARFGDRGGRDEMRNKGLWYVAGVGMAVAGVLSYGSALSDVGTWTGANRTSPASQALVGTAPRDTMSARTPSQATDRPGAEAADGAASSAKGHDLQWPDLVQALPARETLQWSSLGLGILIGMILTVLLQVSWRELPSRFVRWLAANERNFYRLGIAGGCIAVLLFY